jgi:hypothetical protein
MKAIFATIIVIVVLALIGSPVLMWAMQAAGIVTNHGIL